MIPTIYVIFLLAVALHNGAAVSALYYLSFQNHQRFLNFSHRLLILGLGALLFTLILRVVVFRIPPFATMVDSLTLFLAMVSGTIAIVCIQPRRRALLPFYLPAVAALSLLCAVVALPQLGIRPPARDISTALLTVHVVLAFLAYALFFVASMTSIAYIFIARQLKKHKGTALLNKLPSLENLDLTLFRLIAAGYPLFVVTLVLGLVWAWVNPNPLSATWWLSPKIVLSIVMVLFYGISFHSRSLGILRGPKLAQFVAIGFGGLLTIYMLLVLLELKDYNFWSATA